MTPNARQPSFGSSVHALAAPEHATLAGFHLYHLTHILTDSCDPFCRYNVSGGTAANVRQGESAA